MKSSTACLNSIHPSHSLVNAAPRTLLSLFKSKNKLIEAQPFLSSEAPTPRLPGPTGAQATSIATPGHFWRHAVQDLALHHGGDSHSITYFKKERDVPPRYSVVDVTRRGELEEDLEVVEGVMGESRGSKRSRARKQDHTSGVKEKTSISQDRKLAERIWRRKMIDEDRALSNALRSVGF
jgi:hypothetical protein